MPAYCMFLCSKTQDIVVKTDGRVIRPRDLMPIEPNSRPFCGLTLKSIWKGSIAFGLVNIPVRLYSVTESQSLASHMLHKEDLSRIRFQRVATIESNRPPISASLALPWLDELAVALVIGHGAFPEEVFYRSWCEISVVNPLSKNGVTAGSLQLSPTLSMREQSAQSWSFLALPAAPIERVLFAGACSL